MAEGDGEVNPVPELGTQPILGATLTDLFRRVSELERKVETPFSAYLKKAISIFGTILLAIAGYWVYQTAPAMGKLDYLQKDFVELKKEFKKFKENFATQAIELRTHLDSMDKHRLRPSITIQPRSSMSRKSQ